MKLKKLFSAKSKAQAMVEFAIALPVLLLLLYGIIETGRYVFMYSTVVNASRQAVRYGATTGPGNGTGNVNETRYQDCDGMRNEAKRFGFLGAFDSVDITWDTGPTDTKKTYCGNASATTDALVLTGNVNRINVKVTKKFVPIVPKLVPFAQTDIVAESSRSILISVTLNVTAIPQGKSATVTSIVSDTPDPSAIGGAVTVTVNVTGGPTPTGTVQITGADTNCTITLSNGTGNCDVVFTSGGNKTLTATYVPDASHVASTDTEAHAVQYSTGTTITSHIPDPSQPNSPVNVVVTVNSAMAIPDGSLVTITGADTNCTVTITSSTGNCDVIFTSTGSKTLTATYAGDANHTGSSATATHAVLLDKTTVTVITSHLPNPSDIGASVNVAVTVTGTSALTGTVSITGADTNCTITLTNGAGNCNVIFNTVGSKSITATYSGDADHNASSTSVGHSVNLPVTITTITAHTPNPSDPGYPVNVTVSVSGGSTTATGTVTLTGGDVPCTITLSGGTGSCNIVISSSGTKTLAAAYNGDTQHAPSSTTTTHTVTTPPPVASCNTTHGAITKSGNTMNMTITNPNNFLIIAGSGSVTWYGTKGHQSGADKTLNLQSIKIGNTTVWTGDSVDVSDMVWSTPASIPPNGTITITFTFDKSYDTFNGLEKILIQLTTPGCEGSPIQSG